MSVSPTLSLPPIAELSDEALRQVAALPLRRVDGQLQVCLVTTRETRRWTIPKGWPMKGKTDRQAAGVEAREEAGLVGKVSKRPIGSFIYWKRRPAQLDLVNVVVYRMNVARQLATWKEAGQRYVMWFSLAAARDLVDETGLRAIMAGIDESAEDDDSNSEMVGLRPSESSTSGPDPAQAERTKTLRPPLPEADAVLYHGASTPEKETAMAKGQMRSNKETRKPKAEKPKAGAATAPKPFANTTAAAKEKK